MPNLNEKFAEVEALKQGWLQDQNLVNQYIGGEQQLPYMLQQELGKRMPNLALRKQENMLQEQLTTTPTNYATKYPDIKNPLLAGQLAAQREASIERNLQDVRATRQQQEGTVSDIINAATGAYKSKTERLRAQVATKQAQYEAGFGEYKQLSAEEETRKQQELNKKNFEEQIREFDIKQAEDKRQFEEKMKLSYAELRKGNELTAGKTKIKVQQSMIQEIKDAVNQKRNLDPTDRNEGGAEFFSHLYTKYAPYGFTFDDIKQIANGVYGGSQINNETQQNTDFITY